MSIPPDSVSIDFDGHRFDIDCLILAKSRTQTLTLWSIAYDLAELPDVASFTVAHASRASGDRGASASHPPWHAPTALIPPPASGYVHGNRSLLTLGTSGRHTV